MYIYIYNEYIYIYIHNYMYTSLSLSLSLSLYTYIYIYTYCGCCSLRSAARSRLRPARSPGPPPTRRRSNRGKPRLFYAFSVVPRTTVISILYYTILYYTTLYYTVTINVHHRLLLLLIQKGPGKKGVCTIGKELRGAKSEGDLRAAVISDLPGPF